MIKIIKNVVLSLAVMLTILGCGENKQQEKYTVGIINLNANLDPTIAEFKTDSADFVLRGSNIKCNYAIADQLWPVVIDAGQISQVIQNIIINAVDVMPDGGFIEINCENIDEKEASNLFIETGEYVKISIKDDGPGIPTKLLGNIFDPYFTTKEKGSGLGLAITHSIITKHGGVILADSPEGQGEIFTIYLKASCQAKLEEKQTPEVVTKRGKGKIMVMDDDDMIRNFSSRLLSRLGYDVVLAAISKPYQLESLMKVVEQVLA